MKKNKIIPNFSEDLEAPMMEIQKILEKYDIGGFVHLASRKNASFKLFIEPSWSVAEWKNKQEITFSSRKNITDELDSTAHLLLSTGDTCLNAHRAIEIIKYKLAEHFEIEHDNPFEEATT